MRKEIKYTQVFAFEIHQWLLKMTLQEWVEYVYPYNPHNSPPPHSWQVFLCWAEVKVVWNFPQQRTQHCCRLHGSFAVDLNKGIFIRKLVSTAPGWCRAPENRTADPLPVITFTLFIIQIKSIYNKQISFTYSSEPHMSYPEITGLISS